VATTAATDYSRHVAFDTQRAFFDEHGWVVLRDVVPASELERLVEASHALMPDARVPLPSDGVPMLVRPSLMHPDVHLWLSTEPPFRLAAALLGAPAVRLLQDALLVKPVGGEAALAWHRDATYFGYLTPIDVVSVRLALGRETVASGCMWVIDGSHRWDVATGDAFGAARVDDDLARLDRVADGARVPLELAPGDVSLHHARTFHASFPNRGPASRRTLVTHVAADRCRVLVDRLPADARAAFPVEDDGRLAADPFWILPLL